MINWFQNIHPSLIDDMSVRGTVETLWQGDINQIRQSVEWLIANDDVLGRCALFDIYSYSKTTHGQWMADALASKQSILLTRARDLLTSIFDEKNLVIDPDKRDLVLASCMHMIWRMAEPQDDPFVLQSLRIGHHWRHLWPTAMAATLLREDPDHFYAELGPLLAAVAKREDLPTLVRSQAITALGRLPSQDDLAQLEQLLELLPLPEAAYCGIALLDANQKFENAVRTVATGWTRENVFPVRDVLERLNLW